MKKRILIGLITLIVVAIIASCVIIRKNKNSATNEGNVLIKMNEVTRSVFYAPQYVAISNGYFKDYGIEIDLTTGQRCRCCNDFCIVRRI